MGQRKNGLRKSNFLLYNRNVDRENFVYQVDEAYKMKNTDIAKELSLPPVKLHCSMLAEDAIKAALKDYHIKQSSRKTAAAQ